MEDGEDPKRVYELYYEFEIRVDRLSPHQVLAINRGEEEKVLRVKVEVRRARLAGSGASAFPPRPALAVRRAAELAIDGCGRAPAAARHRAGCAPRAERKSRARTPSVFLPPTCAALLGQPPLAGHTVLGIDPGFRTGCKVAVVDPTGKLLETATIYPARAAETLGRGLRDAGSAGRAHTT